VSPRGLGGGSGGRYYADGEDTIHVVPDSRNLPTEFTDRAATEELRAARTGEEPFFDRGPGYATLSGGAAFNEFDVLQPGEGHGRPDWALAAFVGEGSGT
jgi:hypothetical protein